MAEHAGKPKVRFAGFTEDWEQRKLGEVAKLNNGKDYKHLGDGNIPVYGTGGYMLSVNQALSYKDDAIGIGRKGTIDKPYILKAPFWTVDTLFYSIPNDKTELNFLFATFQKVDWKAADESTGVPSLSKSTIENIITFFPSLPEQARIGAFFCHLDRLITLHQRKRGRLENIKKAMLEKMFPKNGADVPEVRFAGFTEAWEQRKVGEYYDFKNGLNKGKEYFGIGTPIVNFTDVFHLRGIYEKDLKGKVSLTRAEIANFQVKMGDIFFTRTSETIDEIGFPSVMLDEPKDTVFSGFVLRGRALQDDPLTLQFKRYVFFTDAFRKEMVKKSSITTRALTSGTAIKNMEFVFPKNKKEQEFIGNFFRHLDRLITLHQRKVTLLQNIKKACLEKMFV